MQKIYGEDWKRNIGIDIASDSEDNAALKFPIKICEGKTAVMGRFLLLKVIRIRDGDLSWRYKFIKIEMMCTIFIDVYVS